MLENRRLLSGFYSLTDLGTLPGDIASFATGINNNGQVVGYATGNGSSRAFIYSNGTMKDLQALYGPNVIGSIAYGINNSGQAVGRASWENGASGG